MSGWTPQTEGLNQIVHLLLQSRDPNANNEFHRHVQRVFLFYLNNSYFNNYFIFLKNLQFIFLFYLIHSYFNYFLNDRDSKSSIQWRITITI